MDRIVEKYIPNNENNYKYFVYIWEIIETGLKYCGYHLGIPLQDGYWHSSEHKKFNKQFSNSNYTLRYKVMGYFKYEKEAKRFEGQMIRELKEKGEYMANISNSSKPIIDRQKIFTLNEKIKEGLLKSELRPKSEIPTLSWFQGSRVEESKANIIKIRRKIDDKLGSVDDTKPVVVARGTDSVLGLGDEVGIIGFHTKSAIVSSKHATQYKRVDVDLSGWSEAEIVKISSLDNDDPMITTPPTPDDYKKELVDLWDRDGVEPDSAEAFQWLKDYDRLSTTDIANIMEKAKVKVDTKKEEKRLNRKKIIYHHKEKETKAIIESHTEDGVKVKLMSSASYRLDRIIKEGWDGDEFDEKIHTVKVLIYHTEKKNRKDWDLNGLSDESKLIVALNLPFDVEFITLPMYQSDKTMGK